MSESAVRVVGSSSLSEGYDRRYVVVDAATGEVIDDAQGYGYKTAPNAHRAHAYKSMSPQKKQQRGAVMGALISKALYFPSPPRRMQWSKYLRGGGKLSAWLDYTQAKP